MPQWARTRPATIALAVRARLALRCDLDESRVIVSVLQPEDVPTFAAYQDVVVRLMSEIPAEDVIDGCGRQDDRRVRTFEVSPRTRVELDETGQALVQLLDASLGHLLLEDAVVDALQQFMVSDEQSNVLTSPMRVGRLTTPVKLRSNEDWVCSTFSVQFEYTRDLDPTLALLL